MLKTRREERALAKYFTVQVGQEVRVVEQSQLASLGREVEARYQSDVSQYGHECRIAARENREVRLPAPVRPVLRVLRTDLLSEDEVDDYRERVRSRGRRKLDSRP